MTCANVISNAHSPKWPIPAEWWSMSPSKWNPSWPRKWAGFTLNASVCNLLSIPWPLMSRMARTARGQSGKHHVRQNGFGLHDNKQSSTALAQRYNRLQTLQCWFWYIKPQPMTICVCEWRIYCWAWATVQFSLARPFSMGRIQMGKIWAQTPISAETRANSLHNIYISSSSRSPFRTHSWNFPPRSTHSWGAEWKKKKKKTLHNNKI